MTSKDSSKTTASLYVNRKGVARISASFDASKYHGKITPTLAHEIEAAIELATDRAEAALSGNAA